MTRLESVSLIAKSCCAPRLESKSGLTFSGNVTPGVDSVHLHGVVSSIEWLWDWPSRGYRMSAVSALYGAKSCEFEGGVGFPQRLERREDEENERVQERK